MRRYLRRNYHGSDHLGAAADYEDDQQQNVISPSKASILAAEAISMEEVKEEDEQESIGNSPVSSDGRVEQYNEEIQTRLSGTGERPSRASAELGGGDPQVLNDQDFVRNPSAVAPGYVPSEHDEQILLELPASMVRPLRVLRGMFQVSFVCV